MEFVAIDTDLGADRVTIDLARTLKVRRAHAAGLLALVYAGMARHAQDGCLDTVLDEQIEEWAYWHGTPGTFATLIRSYLCDAQGVVRAWDRWNGAMIRKAKLDRERKRAARAGESPRPRTVHGPSTDIPRSGAGTVPDRTVPNLTTTTAESAQQPPTRAGGKKGKSDAPRETWLTPVGAAWEARYDAGSFDYRQAAGTLAPLVKAGHSPEEIARRLAWYLDNRGSESTLGPEERRRRHFTPNLRDFRQRFGQFDPSALEAA